MNTLLLNYLDGINRYEKIKYAKYLFSKGVFEKRNLRERVKCHTEDGTKSFEFVSDTPKYKKGEKVQIEHEGVVMNVIIDDFRHASSPYFSYSEELQRNIYYQKVPVTLSDEDLALLKKRVNITPPLDIDSMGVAVALKIIAIIIYIVGFIGAISTPSWLFFICGFISGTLFLGFSEIIKLLQWLNDK